MVGADPVKPEETELVLLPYNENMDAILLEGILSRKQRWFLRGRPGSIMKMEEKNGQCRQRDSRGPADKGQGA